ncbi:MAG: hypothetical protein V2A76_15915 [Planctomycetota bacterium]
MFTLSLLTMGLCVNAQSQVLPHQATKAQTHQLLSGSVISSGSGVNDVPPRELLSGTVIGAGSGATGINPIGIPLPPLAATSAIVPVAGVNSWDSQGDSDNEWLFDGTGGTGSNLTALSWDVTFMTLGASWMSESTIYFDGSDQDGSGVYLTPGVGFGSTGTGTFSSGGVIDLTDAGVGDVPVLADGLIHMEFFESFDDVSNAIDGTFTAGDVTLFYDSSCGAVAAFGSACPGNGGFLPVLSVDGCPQVGLPLTVEVSDCEGGAPWFMLFSSTTGSIPLPGGCTLDLAAGYVVQYLGLLPGAGAGGGSSTFIATPVVANNVYAQCVIQDSTAGLITTNGLNVTVNP